METNEYPNESQYGECLRALLEIWVPEQARKASEPHPSESTSHVVDDRGRGC